MKYQAAKYTSTKQVTSAKYASFFTLPLFGLALVWHVVTCSLVALALFLPVFAYSAAPNVVQTSPAVIDKKAKARDIIKESITLKNTGERPLQLFPAVEDVNPGDGTQAFRYGRDSTERSDSLANWIELSRGVVALLPGEEKTLPFVIHVNMNAVPGTYHAAISFTDGSTRDDTANKRPDGLVTVNLEVQADIKENLQIVKFATEKFAFAGDDVLFEYQIENIGNQDLLPAGDIRIYDRRGQEVASLDVNKEGKAVSPDQVAQLASAWSAVQGFGQFKAIMTVNYGRGQTAAVQDTIFFWIVPWKQILGLLTATLIALIVLVLYFRQWFEEQHLHKLALAGLLNAHPVTAAAIASAVGALPRFAAHPTQPKKKPAAPKVEVPSVPKEHFIFRIVDNAVIAWRLFITFKQRGRITPQDIVQEKEAVRPKVMLPPAVQPQQISHQVPGVEAQWHSWNSESASHGETIDLKAIRQKPASPTTEGHTVNLKKRYE